MSLNTEMACWYLLPSAYLQLMPPAMQVRSPWQSWPLMTQARASRLARATISSEGLGAAVASPRKRTMEVKMLADSILAVDFLERKLIESKDLNEWLS